MMVYGFGLSTAAAAFVAACDAFVFLDSAAVAPLAESA